MRSSELPLVIYNEKSGAQNHSDLVQRLQKQGAQVLSLSEFAGNPSIAQEYPGLLGIGGDGTHGFGSRIARKYGKRYTPVSGGTFNLLSRSLGLHPYPLEDKDHYAQRVLTPQNSIELAPGIVTANGESQEFVGAVGLGFTSILLQIVEEERHRAAGIFPRMLATARRALKGQVHRQVNMSVYKGLQRYTGMTDINIVKGELLARSALQDDVDFLLMLPYLKDTPLPIAFMSLVLDSLTFSLGGIPSGKGLHAVTVRHGESVTVLHPPSLMHVDTEVQTVNPEHPVSIQPHTDIPDNFILSKAA